MFGRAIAEFEFTLDLRRRAHRSLRPRRRQAMTVPQKQGALVFFGQGRCSSCHAVAGPSNEMFSDFEMHVVGVPQIAPLFGAGRGT